MKLDFFQVNAFSDSLFQGNPAAVIPLESWLCDDQLQQLAHENNLSETAYLVPLDDGFDIRWFTPLNEVDLCGHATLASAWVLFERMGFSGDEIRFHCKSGELRVYRQEHFLTLDLPARKATRIETRPDVLQALGITCAAKQVSMYSARDTMVVLPDENLVRQCDPDMEALAEFPDFSFMVTAPGNDCDFVSRFFAPRQGIPEDPVTGSAHCTLAPYWAEQQVKPRLHARQLSRRGGELWCQVKNHRVLISGHACCYIQGEIDFP